MALWNSRRNKKNKMKTKGIMRRALAVVMVCLPMLTSCSHDDEPPTTTELAEAVVNSVWKIEAAAGPSGGTCVEYIRIYDKEWPTLGALSMIRADFFGACSSASGIVYYDAPGESGKNSADPSENKLSIHIAKRDAQMTYYAVDFYISVQKISKNKIEGVAKKGSNLLPASLPIVTGEVTLRRSSVAEMEKFIEQTKRNGVSGFLDVPAQ